MSNEALSLGQRLNVSKKRSDDEKIRLENERTMQKYEEEQEKYKILVSFFEDAKDTIIHKINNDHDKVFITTLEHDKNYEWFHFSGMPDNSKLNLESDPILKMVYDDFKKWLDDNDLMVEPRFCHDGVGIKSWTSFSIKPKI